MRTSSIVAIVLLLGTVRSAAAQDQGTAFCRGEEATVIGTSGDDVIHVDGAPAVVWSGAGDDEIRLTIDEGYSEGHRVCSGIGNDRVTGSDVADVIYGGEGDDLLVGDEITQANVVDTSDILFGGKGRDRLDGGGGVDSIHPGQQDDVIEPSPGADILSYEGASLPIRADGNDTGNGVVNGDLGRDTFSNISTIIGGSNGDHISGVRRMVGGPGGDVLRAGTNGSEAWGGPGADRIYDEGSARPRRLVVRYEHSNEGVVVNLTKGRAWGEGHDRLFDVKNVVATPYDDVLIGTHQENRIYALQGDDEIRGKKATDDIHAGFGHDLIRTGKGNDQIAAGGGRDRIIGGRGPTIVYAGSGTDVARGGRGKDQLYGEDGRDRARGGRGKDICSAEVEKSCERERDNW